MMAAGAKRMENAPPEMKAKMEEVAVKLKGVITNRCTEDKWSADVDRLLRECEEARRPPQLPHRSCRRIGDEATDRRAST